ncbi:MAG: hypothetical protein SO147_03085 [Clostridia bacterium]|nr:hypothetical protein [Clostridia bacterium]
MGQSDLSELKQKKKAFAALSFKSSSISKKLIFIKLFLAFFGISLKKQTAKKEELVLVNKVSKFSITKPNTIKPYLTKKVNSFSIKKREKPQLCNVD